MKKTVKLLCALLAIIMVVGLFAGCQEGGTGTTTTAPKSDEKLKLTCVVQRDARLGEFDTFTSDHYPVLKAFEDMLAAKNLEIEWKVIENDQWDTYITTAMADPDSLPDYIWTVGMSVSDKLAAADAGIFYPIDDILEYSDGTAKKYYEDHPEIKGKNGYKGKLWWIPEYMGYSLDGEVKPWGEPVGVLVREDWLNALKMEIPTTPEAVRAYLEACQENDMNGNGSKDEYYLRSWSSIDYGLGAMFGIPSNFYGLNQETGKIDSTFEMPEAKEYFKFIKGLVADGLIKGDHVGAKDYPSSDEAANQSAATSNYYCNNWTLTSCVVQEGAPAPNYVGCIPTTEKGFIQHDGSPLMDSRSAAFTKNLNNPKAAAAFLDILCSKEFEELTLWGIKDLTYTEDAEGNREYTPECVDIEKAKETGAGYGRDLWGFGQIPIQYQFPMEADYVCCTTDKMLEVNAAGCAVNGTYSTHHDAYMQVPTAEETAKVSELATEIQTLYEEICVDLFLGRIDIDTEWDEKVIKPLKEAGLDELLAIYQARADRFAGK